MRTPRTSLVPAVRPCIVSARIVPPHLQMLSFASSGSTNTPYALSPPGNLPRSGIRSLDTPLCPASPTPRPYSLTHTGRVPLYLGHTELRGCAKIKLHGQLCGRARMTETRCPQRLADRCQRRQSVAKRRECQGVHRGICPRTTQQFPDVCSEVPRTNLLRIAGGMFLF